MSMKVLFAMVVAAALGMASPHAHAQMNDQMRNFVITQHARSGLPLSPQEKAAMGIQEPGPVMYPTPAPQTDQERAEEIKTYNQQRLQKAFQKATDADAAGEQQDIAIIRQCGLTPRLDGGGGPYGRLSGSLEAATQNRDTAIALLPMLSRCGKR
jgi:hypothetical protein